VTGAPADLAAVVLLAMYGGRWNIVARPGGLDVWSAERQSPDGRSIRYIVERSPGELAAKLETAEMVEP
jgi:hypothetical protein